DRESRVGQGRREENLRGEAANGQPADRHVAAGVDVQPDRAPGYEGPIDLNQMNRVVADRLRVGACARLGEAVDGDVVQQIGELDQRANRLNAAARNAEP